MSDEPQPQEHAEESQALENLLLKLHRRGIVGWQDEFKLGKPIYEGLVSRLKARKYSPQVTAGSLTPTKSRMNFGSRSTAQARNSE